MHQLLALPSRGLTKALFLLVPLTCLVLTSQPSVSEGSSSPMFTINHLAGAILLPNSDVLVFGGTHSAQDPGTWLFDPTTNTWSKAGRLQQGREDHQTILTADGKVIVIGGIANYKVLKSTEMWTLDKKQWTPFTPLPSPREEHSAIALDDGRIIVIGGFDGKRACADIFCYDPAKRKWRRWQSLSTPRAVHGAVLLPNGMIVVVGGTGPDIPGAKPDKELLAQTEIIDTSTGKVLPGEPLHEPRVMPTITLLKDGRILIAGGYTMTSSGPEELKSCEIYNPQTRKWDLTSPMLYARAAHTATLLPDGRVFVEGGIYWSKEESPVTEIFDPISQEWHRGPSLKTAHIGTATLLHDGRIMILGRVPEGVDPSLGCEFIRVPSEK